jgi:hypothetical protein
VPLGYYGDAEATVATFPVIDGVRWAVLGERLHHRAHDQEIDRADTRTSGTAKRVFRLSPRIARSTRAET